MPTSPSARRPAREPNRLHRSTERLEDALSVLVGLLLAAVLGIGFLVGASMHENASERARVEQTDRAPVTGVLLEDIAPEASTTETAPRQVPVRWVGRDGLEHTGAATVRGVHQVGDSLPLWEDNSGRLVPPPTTAAAATAGGVVAGLLSVVLGTAAVYAIWCGLFAWTARRFALAWEQEWEHVEPEWAGRTRS